MSMHLLPPMYSTTGKKKGKQKHRNSASAAKARANAESWQQLMEKWDVKTAPVRKPAKLASNIPDLSARLAERSTRHIASVDTGVGVAVKKESPQYTGTECIGIGQLHKSNAVPVFKQADAEDIAKMRRN